MPPPIAISSLNYISPQSLSTLILDPATSEKIAVVDVRDSDYIGGHVKNSIHAPVDQLDARMPELVRKLQDKDRVIFHCMLSQQRGPKSALAYARARARAMEKQNKVGDQKKDGEQQDQEQTGVNVAGQEICVLQGGFDQWQSRFGKDKKLTDGYVPELWDSILG